MTRKLSSFVCGVSLASGIVLCAQVATQKSDRRPSRIISEKNGFSVMFPRRWFVWQGGDAPVFFNFSAEKAPPQGRLPDGGASIIMHVADAIPQTQATDALSSWAERLIRANSGNNVERRYGSGPPVAGVSRALQLSFDQPGFGDGESPTRFVIILWELSGKLFAAELSYYKGDPRAPQHERVLFDVVRSFRPS
jgi:hypothetical protein